MRETIAAAALMAILAAPGYSQLRGAYGRGSSSFASRSVSARAGFGNVLFPGTGGPPIQRHATFAQRLGATVSGYYGNLPGGRNGIGFTNPEHLPARRRPVVAYSAPIYYGGYGYYAGGYNYVQPQPQQVHVTVQNVPAPQPPVIINQYYNAPDPKPVLRDYTAENLPETDTGGLRAYHARVPQHPEPKAAIQNAEAPTEKATVYLIAFRDNSIYAAVGYWIEDGTLHYITTQGSHNRASVALVDRELSEQLNRERNVEFALDIQ